MTKKGPRKNAKTNSLLVVAAMRRTGNKTTPAITRQAVNTNEMANVIGFIVS